MSVQTQGTVMVGTIDIQRVEQKNGSVYFSVWAEHGNRAVYQSDPDVLVALKKGVQAIRRLSDRLEGVLFLDDGDDSEDGCIKIKVRGWGRG